MQSFWGDFMKKKILIVLIVALFCFVIWQGLKKPETNADWQDPLAVQSTAEFKGDMVTVKNVRNFRYTPEEKSIISYYDQDYDLAKISKAWYIVVPFANRDYAAHSFMSFEFSDGSAERTGNPAQLGGKYLTISIEARKKKGQDYSLVWGMLRTYPLMYIAADERDSILMRANIRKDDVYLYPVKATPDQARLLLIDMLEKMNSNI